MGICSHSVASGTATEPASPSQRSLGNASTQSPELIVVLPLLHYASPPESLTILATISFLRPASADFGSGHSWQRPVGEVCEERVGGGVGAPLLITDFE